jgi:translation initiation factor IF-3
VRLIDPEGNMLGVVTIHQALEKAKEFGLDLVEISPNAEPPVCKILDFGKFKFEQRRKQSQGKKKQRVSQVKEIKIRPTIDKHDYEVKMRSIQKFIGAGDKVKVSLRFRGREITHKEIGMALMDRMIEDAAAYAKAELTPRMEGKQIIMILTSK